MGGIYLPLDNAPGEYVRDPLLLAYHRSHFAAVVTEAHEKDVNSGAPLGKMENLPITGRRKGENSLPLALHPPTSLPPLSARDQT